jgi:hypothetical protein
VIPRNTLEATIQPPLEGAGGMSFSRPLTKACSEPGRRAVAANAAELRARRFSHEDRRLPLPRKVVKGVGRRAAPRGIHGAVPR